MVHTFTRSRATWLIYLLLGFYGYCLNIFGPITPFLKNELNLTYTVSSFHFSAFALGMIASGLIGHVVILRVGRWRAAWIAVFGMSLCIVFLSIGQTPILTIGASFLMGLVGSLLLSIVPTALADEHGVHTAKALSEANVTASLVSSTAPVLVGWLAASSLGWRTALLVSVAAGLTLRVVFNGVQLDAAPVAEDAASSGQRLPRRFWVYWVALVLGVSVEFCMIFWSADYFETSLGMAKADAAQAVSLFLGGMIVGRLLASRLVQRFTVHQIVTVSLFIAAVGFLLYWTTTVPLVGVVGLALTGLGTASLYPLILSLAITAVPGNSARASARASLASGVAIFALPLLLGRLADALGIQLAYGIIIVLLVAVFLIIRGTMRR